MALEGHLTIEDFGNIIKYELILSWVNIMKRKLTKVPGKFPKIRACFPKKHSKKETSFEI